MNWEISLRLIALYLGGFFTIVWAAITLKLILTSPYNYKKISKINGSFWDVLKGCSPTRHNGYRDYQKKAGLAVDLKNNKWIEQGTLSEDSLDSILR